MQGYLIFLLLIVFGTNRKIIDIPLLPVGRDVVTLNYLWTRLFKGKPPKNSNYFSNSRRSLTRGLTYNKRTFSINEENANMWPLFTLFPVINTDFFKYTEHSRVRKLPLLYGGHNFVDQWTDALTEEQWKSNSAEFSYALRHAVHQLRYGEGKPVNERRNSASCMTVCEKRDVAKCVCVCFSTNVTQIIRSCRPFCRRQLLLPDWLPLILSHTLTSQIPVS